MKLLFCLALPLMAIDIASLESVMREEMKAQRVPGAVLVVVEKNKVVAAKGIGVVAVENDTPVTSKTLFRLGSTSKIFTALAALKLADSGKLDLNAAVGGGTSFSHLTMRQLLTHTSGLADDAPQDGPHDESALAANVKSWNARYVMAPPGKLFSYANTGYVLAGEAIERVSGLPFASAVAKLVFEPMGMKSTTFRPFEAMTRPLAAPHGTDGKPMQTFPDHAGSWPPGSAFSNAEDLAQFLSKVLPAEVVRPRSKTWIPGREYGYGIMIEADRLFHTGARLGFGSRLEIYPRQEVAIFLVGNRTGALFSKTAEELRRQLNLSAKSTPVEKLPLSGAEVLPLVGKYANGTALKVEFVESDGQLFLAAGSRKLLVHKLADGRYGIKGGAQLEEFTILRDNEGKAAYLCAEVWCLSKEN